MSTMLKRPRRPDETCPVLDPSANTLPRESVTAIGDLEVLRAQFRRSGVNGMRQPVCEPVTTSTEQRSDPHPDLRCGMIESATAGKAKSSSREEGRSAGRTAGASSSKTKSALHRVLDKDKESSSKRPSARSSASTAVPARAPSGAAPLSADTDLAQLLKIWQRAVTVHRESDFPKLPKPKSGDWLAEHKEDGQTLKTFVTRAASMNARPSNARKTLYILPVGSEKMQNMQKVVLGVEAEGLDTGKFCHVTHPTNIDLTRTTWSRLSRYF